MREIQYLDLNLGRRKKPHAWPDCDCNLLVWQSRMNFGKHSTQCGQKTPRPLSCCPTPCFFGSRKQIAELAIAERLPAVSWNNEFAKSGFMLSYGPDIDLLAQRAAIYVDKILKGGKPADLPLEQPTKFEFVLNLRTAKALGFTLSPALLARADEVIE
jgi:putative ABC transport system substrate-binding protein